MEVRRRNVGYAEGGRERQTTGGRGVGAGMCSPGRQGRGITRWDANTNARTRTHIGTQSHSLEESGASKGRR